ncbi:uncharacterized protein [Apostichopus japonicus]|uniref:uncharacterized protein isoform X2 n=1 Tax=Stichopus japonicus TaxID=307972 RepID=UPI003AB40165
MSFAIKLYQCVLLITDEMADIDVQQHPVGLPRSVGSTTLNDTFDLQQNFQEENEVKDVSLTQDQDSEEDDEGDDWLIQEELAKLRAEWDDYVDNLDGELEMEDYPPIDMKERLRKINEEWGAEELVVRTNTKVNFSENLVTFEVPPPDHIDDNDSDLEIEYRVSQVMREDDDDDDEEEEMIGDGDKEDEEHEKEMDVGNDVQGEGDRHGDVSDMFAKQLTLSEQENKEEEELRTDLNEDSNKIQITETSPEKVVEPESFNPEIENKENTESEVNIISETNPATEEKKQEEQVLIERDGKFELKKVSELSAEERNIMGLGSPSEKNRNASNEEGLASPSNGEDDISLEETPKKKERPSTAKTYQSIQRQPVQKRRIQSAKSTTYVTQENLQYDKPEGFSKYGLSPEQKELKKKQMMIKSQRLQDKRQREEEEKKRQQEEADSAFQAWVKRKQQETIERKKLERQQQKKTEVKIQKDPKEAEESYEAWLKAKKQQAKMERKVNKQKKKEEKEAYFYRSRNECDEAFKEWLKTKQKRLKEDNAMKRSGMQQTTQTAQKSRKARNLSKALQVAQTYKYSDYYGYRF